MSYENFEYQSEWNEQQQFAKLFFGISQGCRIAQFKNNVMQWRDALFSKISLLMGIVDKENKEKLIMLRKSIVKLSNIYITKRNDENINKLADKLFYVEADVDSIANKHMPFLNVKKEIDIQGL